MIEMATYTRIFIALAVLAVATSVASQRGRNGGRNGVSSTRTLCDDVTCAAGQVCEIQSGMARCVQVISCANVRCAGGLKCCERSGRLGGFECAVSCDGILGISH